MLDQLESVVHRYDEISRLLQEPAALGADGYRSLMKEYKELTPLVEEYARYARAGALAAQAKELLEDPSCDAELRAMAQAEYDENTAARQRSAEELKLLLLPKDADDDRSAIVEIRGGTGGEEAALFGYDMYRMYTMYAQRCGWSTEIISLNETELGGFKEVSFSVEGEGVFRPFPEAVPTADKGFIPGQVLDPQPVSEQDRRLFPSCAFIFLNDIIKLVSLIVSAHGIEPAETGTPGMDRTPAGL
jgi:protein subunit release factor A